jgi:hypothetical protein
MDARSAVSSGESAGRAERGEPAAGGRLMIVGLGNIGSQVVPLLAGLPGLVQVTLVDPDRYEAANLGVQRLASGEVGRAKARVQARVLRALRPDLEVSAHVSRFEDLPLGLLRGSLIASCVDSRSARQAINRAACALGCTWVDAALAREGSVRARVHLPGHACLECAWGPREYGLLEQRLPCQGAAAAAAPTAAALELGAIAAGLQVALIRHSRSGPAAFDALADRQWFFDLPSGRGWVGAYELNPACRLDHRPWDITDLGSGSAAMTLDEALALAGPAARSTLAVPGMAFVRRLRCPACTCARRVRWRLSGRIAPLACNSCGAPMLAAAFDATDELSAASVSAAVLGAPLAQRGFVAGDVIAVGSNGAARHFQLG